MGSQESGKFPVVIGREFTPHIASTIFKLLDKQELVKSRSVSSIWKDIVDSRTNLWMDPELYRKAANEGNLDFCRRIIEKVDDKNPLLKVNPDAWAQMQDQIQELQILTTWGDYHTPLHIAARRGHVEICRIIMDHLEDKNPKNDWGITPLHLATLAKHPRGTEVYRLIMNEVDDKNPENNWGATPLHFAASLGEFEISKLIVESVDEKNPEDQLLKTPLHEAACGGHKDIFCLIFERVEDKNPPDGTGNTPLHLAACAFNDRVTRQSYVEICRLIIDNVDDKYPVNDDEQTPLDMARERFEGEELEELEQLWLNEDNQ